MRGTCSTCGTEEEVCAVCGNCERHCECGDEGFSKEPPGDEE